MALGDAYATVELYRNQSDKLTDEDDFAITRQLLAVSRIIDRQTGHFLGFNHDDADVERTYIPKWTSEFLDIGDHYYVSVSGISVDGVALSDSGWELWPLNAASMPEPEPYRRIRRLNGFWLANSRVVVEGKAGWPQVPPAIVEKAIELAKLLRVESPRATGQVQEGINAVQFTSRAAQNILAELTDRYPNAAVIV